MATVDNPFPVRKRVLIADDNETMRNAIRSFVEQQPDIEVCATNSDGAEAVEAALALRPDLVILDVQMPGLNGIEAASVVRRHLPSTKTVLFTIHADAIGKTLASTVDANAVLNKGDGLKYLAQTLQALLGNRAKVIDDCLGRAIHHNQIDTASLEKLAERLAAPLTRCDRNLKYLWVNRHYARWLKRPVEHFTGRRILDVIGKNAFDAFRPRFEEVLSGASVHYKAKADYDLVGEKRISATYKPTVNSDGVTDGWIAFVEEITEQRKPEAMLSIP
jgi:DNA-binding NarL/FixJ family response regulator